MTKIAIAQAQREWPYLTQYAQGWPIREHLSRYLINHRNYSKKIQSFESDENEDTDVSITYPLDFIYPTH